MARQHRLNCRADLLQIDRERIMARHALVGEADYFAVLGVRRDASNFEIQRAYETARADYAPESFPGELQKELRGELVDQDVKRPSQG